MHQVKKLAIIGGGPAGLTAAIYAGRALLYPDVFMGIKPGGQLMDTTDVENYPGYPDGVKGPDMMNDFIKQAQRFGANIIYQQVINVNFEKNPFVLETDTGQTLYYHAVIIATGASPNRLGLPEEEILMGRGVSYCAVCDGFFFKGKKVAVVGGGDSACEEALYLSNLATDVYMILRRDVFRASPIMQQRVKSKQNIHIIYNSVVIQLTGNETLKKIILKNTKDGSTSSLEVDGLFVAIGHTPNSHIFKKFIETDELGYIKVKPFSTHTNIPGVFACGDVMDRTYRQAVTAAGTGCMAALDAQRFLESKGLI